MKHGNANSAFLDILQQKKHDHKEDIPRREKGHIAIITMKIDIRPMNSDNTFDRYMLGPKDLDRYNMSNKAQIVIKGASEAECVNKVKQTLEKMNG